MGDVLVKSGKVAEGQISELDVELHGLPGRTIDRATAMAWLQDGHSLVPLVAGARQSPLQLVEVGDAHFIRHDNLPEKEDSLHPGLTN